MMVAASQAAAAASVEDPSSPSFASSPTSTSNKNPLPSLASKINAAVVVIDSPQCISSKNDSFSQHMKTLTEDIARIPVVGIDVEWGESEAAAVIQVGTRRVSFVVIVSKSAQLLEPFRDILADPGIVKSGVGVRCDKQKIESMIMTSTSTSSQSSSATATLPPPAAAAAAAAAEAVASPSSPPPFVVKGEVDLAALVCRTPEANDITNMSLARITSHYIDHTMNKDLSIVCSDWAADSLSKEQIEYAADDAIAGALCFEQIMQRHVGSVTIKIKNSKKQVKLRSKKDGGGMSREWSHEAIKINEELNSRNNSGCCADAGMGSNAASSFMSNPEISTTSSSSATATTTAATGSMQTVLTHEFATAFLKKRVQLKQPKTPASLRNSSLTRRSDGGNSTEVPSFASKMEKRYQNPQEAKDSLDRVEATGVLALAPDGSHLFYLDNQKALWYVKKGIAFAVETDSTQSDPMKQLKKIQLHFEPQRKTKVCRSWHMGKCSMGDSCPYAHGAEDLAELPSSANNNDSDNDDDGNTIKENENDDDGEGASAGAADKKIKNDVSLQSTTAAGVRVRCDMCRASQAGNTPIPVVPSPWHRLMGDALAQSTGCACGLHLCCKCQALMRSVHISERRLLRRDARNFFEENGFHLRHHKKANSSDSSDDDANNDNNRLSEGDLLATVNEASVTRMSSLSALLFMPKRLAEIPPGRLEEIHRRVWNFYDIMVKDGLLADVVRANLAPDVAAELAAKEQQQTSQQHQQPLLLPAALVAPLAVAAATEITKTSKADWLAATEARDIARYFCLRPLDKREATSKAPIASQEHIAAMAAQCPGGCLADLSVVDPKNAAFWARRMFEYYRTIFEQQLRPVIIPWQKFTAENNKPTCCVCCQVSRLGGAEELRRQNPSTNHQEVKQANS